MDTSTLSFCCSALTSLIEAGNVAKGPSMTVTDSPTSKSTSLGVRSLPPVSGDPVAAAAAALPGFLAAGGSRNFTTSSSDSGDGRDVAPTKPVTPGVLRTAPRLVVELHAHQDVARQ